MYLMLMIRSSGADIFQMHSRLWWYGNGNAGDVITVDNPFVISFKLISPPHPWIKAIEANKTIKIVLSKKTTKWKIKPNIQPKIRCIFKKSKKNNWKAHKWFWILCSASELDLRMWNSLWEILHQ